MAKTVVGLFDSPRQARQAVVELVDSGISHEDISTTSADTGGYNASYAPEGRTTETHEDEGIGEKIKNFFSSLFGSDNEEDARYYSDAVRRGGTVVTVDANSDDMAQRAADIMNRYGADVDERDMRSEARMDTAGARDREAADAGVAKIPVIEENVDVGKRQVERGGVQVRTRIVERPVERDVRLHEERVHVERHPVNRPVTADDIRAFREGIIEMRETVEEPVVQKEARVVEEVAINKEVGERTEKIRDTVHATEVNVEETGGAPKARSARAASSSTEDDR
jgi:stress response protein YsnF